MLDIFAQYSVNPKLEQEGKWFDFGGGAQFLLARSHNGTYTRMVNKRFEAHKHTLELKDTPEQITAGKVLSAQIMADVLAHSVVLDWKGVSFKGAELPYSVANAKMLLEIEEFQNEVARRANDFKNYRYEVEASDEKNLPAISNGTSPGVLSSVPSSN